MGQKKTQRLVVLLYQATIAETKTVDLALEFIRTCDTHNKFIIFSNSLSVLNAMNHISSKNPQIQKLLEKWHEFLANKEDS